MALINYKDIDFNKSINKELKTFDFNGSEIAIVPYLSINDKYDLVMVTLQKSLEKGIYNHVKMDMYFELHIIYMYTNIQIDNEDREDEAGLYDTFKRSGLIDKVLENIDENEIETLWTYIYEMEEIIMQYRNTFGAVVGSFIEQLPENMEKAKEVVEGFDPEKIQSLTNLLSSISNSDLNI
jgi:hypothetical protein